MKSFTLKFALLFLLGVGLASTAAAQKIGGVVKDSAGKPVIGASVVVDGTTLGASSGVDGRWTLTVPDASKKTLVISYIGMKTQRIAIGSKTQIDVTLEDESTALDDVVVVGYATVKRRDVVGSVASVNAETLQQMPVASVAEAMTGRMAGVQVTATEGDPDAEIRIRVRGAGSFSSDGAPLYIVDGVERTSIDEIDPNTIERISVLKNQSSTAVYGSRGKNGVIVVTTKGAAKPAADEAVFDEKTGSVEIASASTEDMPFLIVEKMPSFRGGDLNDFRAWVQEHLQYPAEAVERNIQGRVVVTFTIEKEGSASNILVLQSPDKLLADEARRVIASSPAGAWTPGEQRGEKVRVKYTLPVDFYLQGSGDKLSERPEKPQGSLDGILVVGYGATSK